MLGGKKIAMKLRDRCQIPIVKLMTSFNFRCQNFMFLLTWSQRAMISFSLEMLGGKYMISSGVILLIGTLNLSSFSLENIYLYLNRGTVDDE
jgi:hypothetical protein